MGMIVQNSEERLVFRHNSFQSRLPLFGEVVRDLIFIFRYFRVIGLCHLVGQVGDGAPNWTRRHGELTPKTAHVRMLR